MKKRTLIIKLQIYVAFIETEKKKIVEKSAKGLDSLTRIPSSKPLGGSKLNSPFQPSEVNQVSTRTSWGLYGKN